MRQQPICAHLAQAQRKAVCIKMKSGSDKVFGTLPSPHGCIQRSAHVASLGASGAQSWMRQKDVCAHWRKPSANIDASR